jgi:deoxypyrimidine-specific 5' nucleotidase type C protein (NT5C)
MKTLQCAQEKSPAMKKTAVIDIDNTLWQFCDAFYAELRKLNPQFPPIDQWTHFDIWDPYCSKEEFMAAINSIHVDQDNDCYRPYPDARDFLLSLRNHGFRIIIASHRMAETRQPTERWLARHALPYDELHLSFDKTVLFDRAAVVVDDAPATLERAVARGVKSAGLLFPWNRAYANNGFGLFPDLKAVQRYLLEPRS